MQSLKDSAASGDEEYRFLLLCCCSAVGAVVWWGSAAGAAGGRDTIKGESCERPAWVEASNEDRIVWNEQQKLKQH